MNELDRILSENGIRRPKNETLEDLFNNFGRIFAQFESDMKVIKLPTGVTVKIQPNGGKIFVTTDTEKNFIPYLKSFQPLKRKP